MSGEVGRAYGNRRIRVRSLLAHSLPTLSSGLHPIWNNYVCGDRERYFPTSYFKSAGNIKGILTKVIFIL